MVVSPGSETPTSHGTASTACPGDAGSANSTDKPSSLEQARWSPEVVEAYERMDRVGKGAYASVFSFRHRGTGKTLAVKIVRLAGEADDDVRAEIGYGIQLDHPNLVKLQGFWQRGREYHIAMELCDGGDLQRFIVARIRCYRRSDPTWNSGLETNMASRFISQMLSGIAYLHGADMVHRDVKPDNFLLDSRGLTPNLKLADFGFLCGLASGERLRKAVGTPRYVAPEVLRRDYDNKADIWSLGVTCFALCTNDLPFDGASADHYMAQARMGAVRHAAEAWAVHWAALRPLVVSMLRLDPAHRPSARTALDENPVLHRDRVAREAEVAWASPVRA